MENERYEISLKLFLKNAAGKILVLKPATWEPPFHKVHDFPGGRINVTEFATPIYDILMREVAEEIGTDAVGEISMTPVATGRHMNKNGVPTFYLAFVAQYIEGAKITLSPDHNDILWLDLKNVKLEDYFMTGMLEIAQQYAVAL